MGKDSNVLNFGNNTFCLNVGIMNVRIKFKFVT